VGWVRPARVQPTRAVGRSLPLPAPLDLTLITFASLAISSSPPPSRNFSGQLRPPPPARSGGSDPPFDGGHGGPRRSGFHPRYHAAPTRLQPWPHGFMAMRRLPAPLMLRCCCARPWCYGAAMAWLGLAPPRSGVCRRGRHGCAVLLDSG
jgi:hypothetical protein